MEELYNSLEEVIHTIQSSQEYQKCISLKEQMKDNEKVNSLINTIMEE